MPLILRICEIAGLAMPDARSLPLAVVQQEALSVLYLHRPATAVPEATGNADDCELSGVLHDALLRLSTFYFWHVSDLEHGRWAVAHAFNLTNRLRAVPEAEPATTRRDYSTILALFALRQFNARLGRSSLAPSSFPFSLKCRQGEGLRGYACS